MATLTGTKRGDALKHPPRKRYRHNLIAYVFIAPTVLLYVVFVLYPFGRTIYLSLTDWNGFSSEFSFIGFNNYSRLFQDRLFWSALSHNLIWIVLGSIGAIGTALFLALLIYGQPRGWHFFRTVFFLPQVLGPAIVGIIWSLIYAPRRGLLYRLGERLNLGWLQHGFLGDTRTALYAVLVASIWVSIGFFFVIFLAGLQNIDISLLDAAKVDGANGIQRFYHVIIPQLSAVLTMVISIGMINSLRVFDIVFTMTGGGPANASEMLATYAYTEAFRHNNMGYASALITVTSALALIMSTLFIRLREKTTV